MIRHVKSKIRRILGLKNDTDFFSQAGEDAIALYISISILRLLGSGFYVDIGAYHPYKHSNTYLLYKNGWTGINIDPCPGMKELFDRERPRDLNIEAGVGENESELTYYIVEPGSTMNSFSESNLRRLGLFDSVQKKLKIPVFRLEHLLSGLPDIPPIDYLNIDAEGFELEILRGVDFETRAPKMISIEQNGILTLADVERSSVKRYLENHCYTPIAKNVILRDVSTVFYVRNEFIGL